MNGALDTPVTVILFNRPERVRELVGVLRQVRPRHVLAIADGPRPGHPADADACKEAREALDAIDWPCRVEREFSPSNLGCDRRVTSGLSWALGRVDRSIILEDDVLPSVDFFTWAERMLDAYANDERVAMVSGHNSLAVWGSEDCDHLRTCRGSIWGWGTWSRAWQRVNAVEPSGDPASAARDIARVEEDPLVVEYLAVHLEAWRLGQLSAWDIVWGLRRALAGMCAIVSPVNLVRNTGVGSGATRTQVTDDFGAAVPIGPARMLAAPQPASASDATALDRASVLVELMGRCVDPAMAARLSRSVASGAGLPLEHRMRHHLRPFVHAAESLAALEHLVVAGTSSQRIDELRVVLRKMCAGDTAR